MMALTVFAVRSNLVDMKDKPGTLNREKKFPGKKTSPVFRPGTANERLMWNSIIPVYF